MVASTQSSGSSSAARLVSSLLRIPAVLFPYLPPAARVGTTALAVATIAATGIAWWGNTASSAGAGFGVFLAIVLTGFTIAAAALPRVCYAWLNRKNWFPGEDAAAVLPAVGSHIPLAAFTLTNAIQANDHHPAYAAIGGVALVGAVLWVIHEALSAKKAYDDAH